jgi:hypothetical protein
MSDPIVFPAATPALALPLLISGQAQKEFFVNEAFCILDALHARSVTASQPAPPAAPAEGACYRVTAPAQGAWAGHENALAVRIGGAWRFVAPTQGLLVFDRAANSMVIYRTQWEPAHSVSLPAGGATVDTEARAAVTALLTALEAMGVLTVPDP